MSISSQRPRPVWYAGETRGEPIFVHGRQITPIGWAVRISWPYGGFVWNRAWAIEVRDMRDVREDTQRRRLPIHDLTAQFTVVLLVSASLVFLFLRSKKLW